MPPLVTECGWAIEQVWECPVIELLVLGDRAEKKFQLAAAAAGNAAAKILMGG